MDLQIAKARDCDLDEIVLLYDELNDYLAANANGPGWRKGVYPTRVEVEHFHGTDALYVAKLDGEIAGSFALTYEHEKDPDNGRWQIEAGDDEVFVVHIFAVHPKFLRRGVGSAMLKFADELAVERGLKAIRLDVYDQNLPAIRTYERNGYRYIDTVDLGLGHYGLDWFRLYEKVLAPAQI